METLLTIVITAAVTALAAVFVLNLTTGEKKIKHHIAPLYGVDDPQFRRAMSGLLAPPLLQGNRVVTLINGDRIFPAMLGALRGARKTICFETYIYWTGAIAVELAEALAERARAGVRVHVVLDWSGSLRMDERLIDIMTDAGVEVQRFHPLRWYNLSRVNNRTHRKLLIVDGVVGFTGGVGIADEWTGDAQDPQHWRDTHFELRGPAVAQMQAAFMDHWLKTRGEVLHGDDYYPPLKEAGPSLGQCFMSESGEGSDSARLMYLLSIASAQRSVRLAMAYFVPDDLSVETLLTAARRGVRIQVIVPGGYIDAPYVRWASWARWGPLLQAGIEIYEYQPTMYHCKIMVVDDLWCTVGSVNFDNRSFRLNDEANLNLMDAEFARVQSDWFDRDLQRSRRISYDEWRNRPLWTRVKEHAAAALRSQM